MSLFIAVLILFINAYIVVKVGISEIIKYIHKDKTVKNEDASLLNNDNVNCSPDNHLQIYHSSFCLFFSVVSKALKNPILLFIHCFFSVFYVLPHLF